MPMQFAEAAVKLMMGDAYIPLPLPRVAEKLGVVADDMETFRARIEELRVAGVVVVLKKERLCLAKGLDRLAFGRIHFHSGRAPAFFYPDEDSGLPTDEPLKIEVSDAGIALHKDRVLVRVLERRGLRGRVSRVASPRYGCVLFVVERAREEFVGTLRRSGRRWCVQADDPRVRVQFLVPDPAQTKLDPAPKTGDSVMVRLVQWNNPMMEPECALVGGFGKAGTPDSQWKSLLAQYRLNPEFPRVVEAQAEALPDRVSEADLKDRQDLRKKPIFTIDPETARDFDDALGIEPTPDGGWCVGVHIADVSFYVRPGSPLDEEALSRGNSTYLVGSVVPMLPHKLSSGLCSLMEGQDRLVKSVFLYFDRDGVLLPKKTEFSDSVIRSVKRLSYRQAIVLLRNGDNEAARNLPPPPAHETGHPGRALADLSDGELDRLRGDIQAMWKLADRMRRERMFGGAFDLDMPEIAVRVDARGYACAIDKLEYDESHQLVEEFMLAANEAVAREMRRLSLPLIHRVHDKPDEEKLSELAESLRAMGLDVHDLSSRKEMCRALDLIRAHPQSHILRSEFLRSLKQACYRAEADGHYGLNKINYTHFTSPIRRYADLIVHRVFETMLERAGRPAACPGGKHYNKAALVGIAEHISRTEQNSTLAERDSQKVKLLEYFERECVGRPEVSFEAVVMDVRKRGIFVELADSMAYGMIPSSALRDDLYTFHEDRTCFVGRRKGRVYAVGDSMRVTVLRVDTARRLIDFAPAADKRLPASAVKGRRQRKRS